MLFIVFFMIVYMVLSVCENKMREREGGEKKREREERERESLYYIVGYWLCNFMYLLCKFV